MFNEPRRLSRGFSHHKKVGKNLLYDAFKESSSRATECVTKITDRVY
jgi:hypothetical protein